MSLFNQLTPAQQAAQQVLRLARQSYNQLATAGRQGWTLIWNNPDAGPADVLAALGTNASVVFQLANLNLSTVAAAAALGGTVAPAISGVPAPYTVTFNPDGSAVITSTSTQL